MGSVSEPVFTDEERPFMQAVNMILILGQAAAPGPIEQLTSMLVPLGIIFFIFYLLIWRPQSKERQKLQEFLDRLSVGDEVVTVGGILGKVTSIDTDVITLEIWKGTKLKVLRRSIQGSKENALNKGDTSKKDEDSKKGDDSSEDDD